MDLIKERENVASFMRRLYRQKLTTTSGGNVSVRLGDTVMITSSQTDKATITGDQIGIISLTGKNLTQGLKISLESKMHLAIYKKRNDVRAIVHAHPVFATSFAISGKEIQTNLAGESWAVLGKPVVAKYALMGSVDLAETVAQATLSGNVILMENHGILTTGETLLQAYDRMEVLEAAAGMTLITTILGGGKSLTNSELKAIDKLFE